MICSRWRTDMGSVSASTSGFAPHQDNSNEHHMHDAHWPTFELEKIDADSDRVAAYVALVIALIGGLSMLFIGVSTGMRWLGMVAVIGACLGYAHLLRSAPKLRYFRYFWLDRYGVHHIEGNTPSDRTARYAWRDIGSAEASTGADEIQGVTLTLNRRGMRNVPVLLTLEARTDGERAAALINDIVMAMSQTGNPSSGAQVSWWLDWSALPEHRIWARLTVADSGTAAVLDCDGRTLWFASEEDARSWLVEDEFSQLENLLDEFDLAGVAPPSAPTHAALVLKMND